VLAGVAKTTCPIIKTTFSNLARQWIKLATHIEMTAAIRADLEPGRTLSKVPEVTLAFWIIKIAATTLGETGGDA
jgi:hypothetical protein